jgi:hypothetical protein
MVHMLTYVWIHQYIPAYIRMHVNGTYAQICMHTYTHTYALIYACMNVYTHIILHRCHLSKAARSLMFSQPSWRRNSHPLSSLLKTLSIRCVCVCVYTHLYIHTRTCAYVHTRTYICICIYSRIQGVLWTLWEYWYVWCSYTHCSNVVT